MKDILIPVILIVVGGFSTWFFSRSKVELEIIQAWKKISDDLREEVATLTKEVKALRQENHELKAAYEELMQTLTQKT